jgi:uncharacterized protein YndB with AHSA1/START domain
MDLRKGKLPMTKIVVEQIVEAPVAEVWKSWDNFGNIASFNPNLKASFLLEGSAKSGLGAQRQCDMSDGKNYLREEVIEYVPEEKLAINIFEATIPMKSGTATFELTPVGKGRTQVRMTMNMVPKMGVVGAMLLGAMKPKFKAMLQDLLRGNAAFVEQGTVINAAA